MVADPTRLTERKAEIEARKRFRCVMAGVKRPRDRPRETGKCARLSALGCCEASLGPRNVLAPLGTAVRNASRFVVLRLFDFTQNGQS